MGKNAAITRRTTFLMLAIALILCLLCGCTPEPRAEDGVKSDLSSSSVFQQYFDDGQSITDFTVTKRQTDIDNKTDTAWVEVWAENEEKSADLSFIMQYTLYNDGWLLENVAENREAQWEFTPKSGPSEDLISSTVPAEATNIEQEDYQGENTLHVSYSMDIDCNYYIKREECSQEFYFDTMGGSWISSERVILTEEKDFAPMIGVWTCDPEYTGEIDPDTGEEIMAGAEFEITNITLDSDGNPWEAQGEMIVLFQMDKYGGYYQGGYEENLEDMVITEMEDKLKLAQGIGQGWIAFQKDETGELTAKVYWERRNNGYYGVTVGDEDAFVLRKASGTSDSDSTTPSTSETGANTGDNIAQSVYWNGVGTSLSYPFSTYEKCTIEALEKSIDLNPRNISPYLKIINGLDGLENNIYLIPEYVENMQSLRSLLLASGLEEILLSNDEENYTITFTKSKNSLVLADEDGQSGAETKTLLFDDDGRLMKIALEKNQNKVTIRYQYNTENRVTSVWVEVSGDNSYSYEALNYTYDERGWLIKALEYDEEGEVAVELNYEYNSDGLLACESHPTTTADGVSKVHETSYTYDAQERLTQERSGYINEEDREIDNYEYDDYGRVAKVISCENDGTSRYTLTYTYDSRGWLSSYTEREGEITVTLTLDEYGNKETDEKNTYDANGNPTHAWGYDIEYTFAE